MVLDSSLEEMLGYLNYSDGTPSAAFAKNVNEFYRNCPDESAPWSRLHADLRAQLDTLQDTSSAFRDVTQARSILTLVFEHVLPAYREHHRGLLDHLSDSGLIRPFFLVKVTEATLAQQGPWDQVDRITEAALDLLNDFIGHRPVAVLETSQKIQPYSHERCRPIPIYLRDVGVSVGPDEELVTKTLEILRGADRDLLLSASLDLELLDELALDPRAYDHLHPANQRPGYQFGEWDPHHLDGQARYRRFILRPMILEALVEWIEIRNPNIPHSGKEESLFEAAATLAGSMLLSAGLSGSGPDTPDSQTSLGTLVNRVARCRDEFYSSLLNGLSGPMGQQFREDAAKNHQPFGGIRQHLNQYLGRQRAAQLQADHLAQLFAMMGYPEAACRQSRSIDTPATRLRTEIQNLITEGFLLAEKGKATEAVRSIAAAEDLLHRSIGCGAIVDPWNVLGFAGNYSIFPDPRNSVPDPRIDQLLFIMQEIFRLYAAVLKELATNGRQGPRTELTKRLLRLADWWDRFATTEVGDLRWVSGRESADSALFVSKVLADWSKWSAECGTRNAELGMRNGEESKDSAIRNPHSAFGDVRFWRRYAQEFTTPQAYALVVDPLLRKKDYVASMALLMHWLSQTEYVPLEDETASLNVLLLRWMAGVLRLAQVPSGQDPSTCEDEEVDHPASSLQPPASPQLGLIKKFFDFLEANAEEYWEVPDLEADWSKVEPPASSLQPPASLDEEEEARANDSEETFAAAYEGVTFHDSGADGVEGSTAEGWDGPEDDELEYLYELIFEKMRFLSTLAKLWRMAAIGWNVGAAEDSKEIVQTCLQQALTNERCLARLIDQIHSCPIPPSTGSQESVMEYDRRRSTKSELLDAVIATRIETAHAIRILRSVHKSVGSLQDSSGWEQLAISLEISLRARNVEQVRAELPKLLKAMEAVPLLYVPLDRGGKPSEIFEARYVREVLRSIVQGLPRLGLLRETYQLLKAALAREKNQSSAAHQVTEFSLLFPVACRSVMAHLTDALDLWDQSRNDDQYAAGLVAKLVANFSRLWLEHLRGVRLSELELRTTGQQWKATVEFIRAYGRELFTQQFLSLANLRGILHQGVSNFLDRLIENEDPYKPSRFAKDLGHTLDRGEAQHHLEFILRSIVENYEAYMDYNATTPQSDYGENLHVLLDLLRVQAEYLRHQWALRPAAIAHDILARKGKISTAVLLQKAFSEETRKLADAFEYKLKQTEKKNAVSLASIRDRIGERFIRPLQLSRILALVEPAMRETQLGSSNEVFERFQHQIEEYTRITTGTGFGVPRWIRQLDSEVFRVARTIPAQESRDSTPPPAPSHPVLTLDDLKHQLENWDEPI